MRRPCGIRGPILLPGICHTCGQCPDAPIAFRPAWRRVCRLSADGGYVVHHEIYARAVYRRAPVAAQPLPEASSREGCTGIGTEQPEGANHEHE